MSRRKPSRDESFEYASRGAPPPRPPSGSSFHGMPKADAGGKEDGDAGAWWLKALLFALLALALWPPIFRFIGAAMGPVLVNLLLVWALRQRKAAPEASLPTTSLESLQAPYRQWVEQGRAVHAEIQSVIARLPSGLRGTFWPLTQQARELVTDLENLARSAQQMDAYLSGPHGRRVAQEMERLRGEISRCTDPVAREQLQQACNALGDALSDQMEIRTLSERAKAEATHINASLQSVLSECIKQRYADLDTAREEYSSAAERLRSVKSHVDAVQQVIGGQSLGGE